MRLRATAVLAMATAYVLVLAGSALAGTVTDSGLSYVTKTAQLGPKKTQTTTAACPKHTRVLGGGVLSYGDYGETEVRDTFPADLADKDRTPDDGWSATVASKSKDNVKLKTTAVCGKTPVSYISQRVNLEGAVATEHDVGCPSGRFAYSGGVEAADKRSIRLEAEFPYSSSTGSTKWGGYYKSVKPQAVKAFTLCGPHEPTEVTLDENDVSPGVQAGQDVECPPDTRVYGGGVAASASYPGATVNTIAPVPPPKGGANGWFEGFLDISATYGPDISVTAMCGPVLG